MSNAKTRARILVIAGILFFPALVKSQRFIPYDQPGSIIRGSWSSCPLGNNPDEYAEKIYDHIVNGVGLFELHLGPRHEFAIFMNVEDEEREHSGPANLLGKDYIVASFERRGRKEWMIPSLGVKLSVNMGGEGPSMDCENYFVVLTKTT